MQLRLIPAVLLLAACAATPPAITEQQEVAEPDASELDEAAVEAVVEPRDLEPIDADVFYHILAGEVTGKEGEVKEALEHYLEAALNSDDPAIAQRTTRLALQAGLWEQAVLASDRWTVLQADNIEAREAAVLSRLQVGDFFGASRHLEALFETMQDDTDKAWQKVSVLLARSPSPEKAVEMLRDLIDIRGDSDNASSSYAQSQLAMRLGDPELAEQLANQAVARSPDRADLRVWAGRLALRQGNLEGAMLHFAVAYSADPENRDTAMAYAELLHRSGSHQQAQQVLAGLPQNADVVLNRLVFALDAEDQALAEDLYAAMQSSDAGPEREFHLAQAAELMNLPAEAIEWYRHVPEGERWLNAQLRQAVLLVQEENLETGRRVLAELQGHSSAAVVEQAFLTDSQLLQQADQPDRAIQTLTLGLTKIRESTALRYNRALIQAAQENVAQAEQDLRLLLAQNPENPDALNALGYTLTDLTDRHQEALGYIRKALALKPNDPAVIDSMGWVLYRLGDLDRARQLLEQAYSMARNPEIAAHLGDVLWQLDEQDVARAILREAHQQDTGNPVLKATMDRLGIEY